MVVVAQLVRAPDCGSGGRRFETDLPPKQGRVVLPFLWALPSCVQKKQKHYLQKTYYPNLRIFSHFFSTYFPFFLEDYHFFEKIVATTINSAKLGLLAIKQPPFHRGDIPQVTDIYHLRHYKRAFPTIISFTEISSYMTIST